MNEGEMNILEAREKSVLGIFAEHVQQRCKHIA